jgi:hypothetical protein
MNPLLQTDIDNWKRFIANIFANYPNSELYLKGGSVIGFLLLKEIYNHHGKFDAIYENFKQMNLIKDYDFVLEEEECCSDYFYYEFGRECNISLNGTHKYQGKRTFLHVMRSIDILKSDELFEMSVCVKDTNIELPLTTMKIKITKDNFIDIFELIEKNTSGTIVRDDLKILEQINVDIPKHDNNGMFECEQNIDYLGLSNIISNVINGISDNNNHRQCLCYLVKNPTDLSRLRVKNIPKSDKIKNFYRQYFQEIPTWLLNNDVILNIVDKFINIIGDIVNDIYSKYNIDIDTIISNIDKLENMMNIYDCDYDLAGIGGDPKDVIDFLNNNFCGSSTIKNSPRIAKLLSKKKLNNNDIKNMINEIEKIRIKCEKFEVIFSHDMMTVNYGKLKEDCKKQIYDLRVTLTGLYEIMIKELGEIFEGMYIIRWKDTIKIYKTMPTLDPINCITNIFNFAPNLKIKLMDGNNIITNAEYLSTNGVWLMIIELHRLK